MRGLEASSFIQGEQSVNPRSRGLKLGKLQL
jgi:hypothetical protein